MRSIVVPVIALGMALIVPLGLRQLAAPGLGAIRSVWPVPAAAGVVSLLLPTGVGAAAVASLYAVATVALAATAAARLWHRRGRVARRPDAERTAVRDAAQELAVLTALVTPAVAGSSLVAERGGWELLGFGPKILLLTVAHFHYAGFAAALVASLVGRLPGVGWGGRPRPARSRSRPERSWCSPGSSWASWWNWPVRWCSPPGCGWSRR